MTRREARERAFEILYEAEIKGENAADLLRDLPVEPSPFTQELVRGVSASAMQLDRQISGLLRTDWNIDRLATTDHLLLRLGLWELGQGDTPRGVVLAELTELASRYGDHRSGPFVNGLLAAATSTE